MMPCQKVSLVLNEPFASFQKHGFPKSLEVVVNSAVFVSDLKMSDTVPARISRLQDSMAPSPADDIESTLCFQVSLPHVHPHHIGKFCG
ncbi:unnamed protein product [Schistocephalus solidus]|uniref:VPS13_mid_rpt domain-containing protein n=1 Tax=Schistocephalus solidus TaxID=70667 RepID=A0A183SJC2_SCHSO|nr:unnamed protein product [Schistocephalus solidus]